MAKGILGIVLGLCLGWLWTAANAQEKSELWRQGQEVYIANCADCHRSNGEGLSDIFPALQKEPFVVGNPQPLIQLILEGKKAKVGHMPAWKNTLTDQQIAAVVTFIRQSWGNQAEAVTAEMVGKNRKN